MAYYLPMAMILRNKVKIARVMAGELTQQELADKVSCSRQTIHSIESSKFVPSIELSLKLAQALNCKVEELFYLEKK
ncbi:MAG: helix-turn-helix transcriptional regulator [Bdellovibrionota bacterium]